MSKGVRRKSGGKSRSKRSFFKLGKRNLTQASDRHVKRGGSRR